MSRSTIGYSAGMPAELKASTAATDRLRKALGVHTVLAAGFELGKQWYRRVNEELTYTVALSQDDAIYSDVHEWLLAQLPPGRQRALTARALPYGVSSPTIEGSHSAPRVQLLYDGTRRQTVILDGLRIKVTVEKPDIDMSKTERETVPGWGRRERTVFQCRSAAGRDAIIEVLNRLLIEQSGRHQLRFFVADSWGSWTRRTDLPLRSLDTVVLRQGQKEEVCADLAAFIADEDVYNRLGMPYHRGLLFWGPPGTGKTSLAKALAVHFGLDIRYIPLASIKNDGHLMNLLGQLDGRCLLLLEDIDIVHGARKRDDSEPGVTLSGLLNSLDGLATPHGLITVMTTNDKDVIDPALLRPGRVDRQVEIGYVDDEQLRGLVGLVVDDPPLIPVGRADVTPAEVVEVLKRHSGKPEDAVAAVRDLVKLRPGNANRFGG